MYAVCVLFQTKPEAREAFMVLMRQQARNSLEREPGCKRFDICTDPSRPDDVFLYEIYDDAAAFDLHSKSDHFLQFDATVADMVTAKTVDTYGAVVS